MKKHSKTPSLTLVGGHRADGRHVGAARRVTRETAYLAHHPLPHQAHHQRRAVAALGRAGERPDQELVRLVLHRGLHVVLQTRKVGFFAENGARIAYVAQLGEVALGAGDAERPVVLDVALLGLDGAPLVEQVLRRHVVVGVLQLLGGGVGLFEELVQVRHLRRGTFQDCGKTPNETTLKRDLTRYVQVDI